MSSKNTDSSQIIGRILDITDSYATDKEFLNICKIGNRSFLTDLKKRRNQNPSAADISKIVRGTGCSGTWLLTGRGEMFPPQRQRENMAGDERALDISRLMQLLRLLKSLEMNKADLEGLQIPAGLALKAAQLTASILEVQQGAESEKDS